MRLKQARIAPLQDSDFSDEQKEVLKPMAGWGPVLNIFRTLVRAPRAFKRFNFWAGYILSDRNDLSPRDRELIILRVGYLCSSGYEWAQHEVIGRDCGLTDVEIQRIKEGPTSKLWGELDRAYLNAADELVRDHFIGDDTWAALSSLTDKQKMDVVFTVGQYTQVSMILNSFGVQLDEGLKLDPDLQR
jgi:4-carboxymuconolactone decarboxylase